MLKKISLGLVSIIIVILFAGCSNTGVSKSDGAKEEKYARIRGINLAAEGKYEEALKSFMAAYNYDKKNVFTVRSIGILYCKLGDFEKGKKYFTEALKIDSTDSETIYNLAIIYFNEKNYTKSLDVLMSAPPEKITKNIIKAKGIVYKTLGEYQKSYEQLIEIVAKEDDDADLFVTYIDILKKLNKNNQIYSFLYSKYQKSKSNLSVIFLFTDYLKEINALDEALQVLKDYGNNFEYNTEVLLKITEILYEKSDFDSSEKYINVVSQKDSLDERVLVWKHKIYSSQGKTEQADQIEKILNNIKRVDKNEK